MRWCKNKNESDGTDKQQRNDIFSAHKGHLKFTCRFLGHLMNNDNATANKNECKQGADASE